MLKSTTLLLSSLLLTGCASQAALIEALAKDPAANCVSLTTPYGGVFVARATPGVRVSLQAGACSIEASR